MNRWLSFLALTLCASGALAEPPNTGAQQAAQTLIDEQVIKPAKKLEAKRSKFSREAPAPAARRVRLLDQVALTDAQGKPFIRFAVDVHYSWEDEGQWHQGRVQGCVYPDERQVFVQQGDSYYVASSGSGKRQRARNEACRGVAAVPSAS